MATSSIDIVRRVSDNAGVTQAELAEFFGLSPRTIRAHVLHANNELRGFASIDTDRGGYSLNISDETRFASWIDQHSEFADGAIPTTQEDRVTYLLHDLLERSDWITLEDLSQVLFISKSRLSRCVKQVEATLARFNLRLEKRPHYGMRMVGTEMDRRLCLASLAVTALQSRGGIFNQAADAQDSAKGGRAASIDSRASQVLSQAGIDNHELLDTIVRCVNESTRESGFRINSAAYQNLIVHIAIALIRIEEGCYVPLDPERLESIKESQGYQVAQAIAARLLGATGIELPVEEIAYIAIHLAGKRALSGSASGEDNLVISDEVWDVVSQILEAVWNGFRFDFRSDLELRMNLAKHIVPLAVRLKFNMTLKNPLLADVRSRFPLAYSMAIESAAVLTRHYGVSPSEDEIGYIAFAFALALERQKTGRPKKNIMVVCSSGAGSARLLEYRLRQEFGDLIEGISSCDVMALDRADFSNVDYVFTTVPIPYKLSVPVLEVKYFLDSSETESVKELLRTTVQTGSTSLDFIDQALFFPHQRFTTKQEVLDFMLDRLTETYPVSPECRELVWKREAMMPTALGNLVAMPHPLEAASDETHICVLLLDEPIPWDNAGHDVQAVFLMVYARGIGENLRGLVDSLASVFFDPSAVAELLHKQDRTTLVDLLDRFRNESEQ